MFLEDLLDSLNFDGLNIDIVICCPGQRHQHNLFKQLALSAFPNGRASENIQHTL